jgi:pimeloyl-ACP methyl ester carboxylesterase
VFLNAMIPAPGESAGEWWDNTGQGTAMQANDRREGRAVDDASGDDDAGEFDVHAYFLHDLPAELVDESWEHAREQSDTPFGTSVTTTAWLDVPTKVIVGRDDRFFPADFQRRVAEERLGITPDVIPGGHLLALSQPEALVEQLETYRGAQPKAGE